jgi:hypothetical protein
MAYRGEDLDLRTPQTWSGSAIDQTADPYAANPRGRSGYSRATPILVDEAVLACCNHAFDVAVAHRAGEVRIEHLLHAMTRLDGASNALEARGIRVGGLRRESATIIASEIPIGLSAGQGRPRRSDDVEQTLRTASAIAARRNSPANVDDVLDALLDLSADNPGIALLARHGGRVARDRLMPARERERDREREIAPPLAPLPPLTRTAPGYGNDLRTGEPRKVAQQTYYAPEPARASRTNDLVGTQTDGIQNARIDQLETAVRTLTADLSDERNALSAVLSDLQRTMKSERDDTSRFRGGLHDRLESLEQTMQSGSGKGDSAIMLDRLSAVERGLDQRLGELSRPWSILSDRLQGLEQTILDTRSKGGDTSGLTDRIVGLERAVRDMGMDGSRREQGLVDRLKGIERALDQVSANATDLGPIASRLDMIEEAVLSPAPAQDNDKISERLRTLEDAISAQRTLVVQATTALNTDVKALASALASQAAGNERVQSFVTDRMQTLASGFERQRVELTGPLTERINSLASVLDNRMQAFIGQSERQRTDMAQPIIDRMTMLGSDSQRNFTALAERIGTLESQLALAAQKAAEAQASHAAELKEVHDALIKLNTNQHTLAGSIDQWRLDGVGDITVIANRLDSIEKTAAKPVQMIEQLTTSVDNINKATVERYHRRNRFWYWLFGTDDWLTASWPSQVASIEAERAALKGATSGKVVSMPPAPANKAGMR